MIVQRRLNMPLTDKQAFEENHEVRISCVLREQVAKFNLRKGLSALTNRRSRLLRLKSKSLQRWPVSVAARYRSDRSHLAGSSAPFVANSGREAGGVALGTHLAETAGV